MTYGDREMKLPIRLVPRRSRGLFGLLLSLIWAGIVVAMVVFQDSGVFQIGSISGSFAGHGLPMVIIAFLVLLGLYSVGYSGLKAWPGGPYLHLEISEAGLSHRRFFKQQNATWQAIDRLSVVDRLQSSGKSKTRHWWVLAEGPDSEPDLKAGRRISKALLAFDANDLAPMMASGEEVATALRDELDDLLKLAGAGRTMPAIVLLPILRDVAIAAHPTFTPGKAGTVQTPPRRRSVIER